MVDRREVVTAIEDAEVLDATDEKVAGWVTRITREDRIKSLLSGTWLGHPLHPLLTDMPIGAWTMATAIDLTMGRRGGRAAQRLVALGLLAAVPTAAAGATDWADSYGPEQRLGAVHGLTNLTAMGLHWLSWRQRRRGHRLSGVALSLLGLGLTTAAGYLGGHLSFRRGVGVNHTAFQEEADDWADVCAESDVAQNGKPLRVTVGEVPVMVVRDHGTIYALSNTCVHAGGPLDEGTIADGTVTCPWHGSRFRLSDGHPLRGPAAVDQPSWQVRVDDGRVLVKAA